MAKKYTKIYINYYDYGEQDVILCENCRKRAVDIHHIKFKSKGGTNDISNLIALCRDCHIKAHKNKKFNKKLQEIKNKKFNK